MKSQSGYIKELEKKVDNLTAIVKKEEKVAELATKKMETMTSRLTAFTTTNRRGRTSIREKLSDSQESWSAKKTYETENKIRQAGQKRCCYKVLI